MSKRELIEPNEGDKRYIRRDEEGQIDESVDLNRSLSQDDQHNSKKTSKPGQGDKATATPATASPANNPLSPQRPAELFSGPFLWRQARAPSCR